ncbi:MAG TPA: CHASE sensor domain-containing protein [Hyphomonadaceae bacterium]|nr:CHASE sensor domain-containing protein [Hyphomonadaceae bacterium]
MTRPFRWSRSWDVSRYATALAVTTAAILLAVGVIGAWMSERDFRSQKMQQAQAHARVLAASVSAALAFDETPEAEQAISALRANPEIGAVGIYGPEGVPFILRGNETRDPPLMLSEGTAPHYDSGSAIATAPVMQAGQQLGRVYVELSAGSGPAQWMRYVGVALLLAMAAVLVGAIAIGQRSLAAANKELARRAATLTQANAQLTDEMAARKKAERALAQAQKMEAIGQLTGGLAHDFNNILAAISGGVRLIERTGDPDLRAQVKASLADAIERGARLTRQLLAFARGQNLEARVTDPCERIVAMVELLRRSLGEDVGVDTSFPGLR